jgi:hypothetical protein
MTVATSSRDLASDRRKTASDWVTAPAVDGSNRIGCFRGQNLSGGYALLAEEKSRSVYELIRAPFEPGSLIRDKTSNNFCYGQPLVWLMFRDV